MMKSKILKDVKKYVNNIIDNEFHRIIASDILMVVQRRAYSDLLNNSSKYNMTYNKMKNLVDEIIVLFNSEKQKIEVKIKWNN